MHKCESQKKRKLKTDILLKFWTPCMDWLSDCCNIFLIKGCDLHTLTENQGLSFFSLKSKWLWTSYCYNFVKFKSIFRGLEPSVGEFGKFLDFQYMPFSLLHFSIWKMKIILLHFRHWKRKQTL